RLVSECDDGTELLKKNAVLDQYDYQQCVCIGDGYTDFTMSARGDFVCARDQLADYLFENNMPFAPWDDFFDILRALEDAGILSKKND
ncbi:hypothetical protein LJC07_08390, partial [Christensenellaceae bacterium OttesenSCG-928-L17]|nr:hypothetical protein [Christensenellaceae bacterium OttesenSCG-928-L17]